MGTAEQRPQIRAAEREVDRLLRKLDGPDVLAVRRQYPDAARPGAVNVALAVHLEAVGYARAVAYVQVGEEEQNLWEEYSRLQEFQPHFAMRKVTQASQIYPVFRELFKKESIAA